MNKVACVILAAGEGTRMKSTRAKVTHELAGKPLILYALETAKSIDPEKVIVIVGHDSERVKNAIGEGVCFVEQTPQRGTGHAVLQIKSMLSKYEGTVLILSGDVPLVKPETLRRLVHAHMNAGAACTLLTAVLKDPTGYGRIIRRGSGKIYKIVEEGEASLFERVVEEINSGIYCFSSSHLSSSIERLSPQNRQEEFYLTDVVEMLAEAGMIVESVQVDEPDEILGINSRLELAQAEAVMQRWIQKRHMLNGVTIISPESTYIDEGVAIGQDTIIYPFTVIEGDVKIGRGCRIGPFSHIRTGSVIKDTSEIGNFVEVKKTVIGEGTKAKHLSYLGDTTIGRNANIGAGSITANYDGVAKYRTEIGDGAFIGSGTTLVAPVKVGKKAVTGAGSVILRGRDVPEGSTVAGVPAKLLKKKKASGSRADSGTTRKGAD
jgi:bifunctional UDP-N-acetylglucosamine pyrophosphorylase/glucosamine-1-phosphate N-acetyltransferase